MILPPTKTVQINKGQKYHSFCFQIGKTLTFQARSPRGLGSSDLTFWVQEITTSKPLTDLHWPSFWPTHTTENELMGFKKGGMQSGNAAEEKVRESLKPGRVVSSPLWEIFNQRLDGCLSSKKL